MSGNDNRPPFDQSRALVIGIALNVTFALAEAAAGFVAGSLALLADAGHNMGDVLGLLLTLTAGFLSSRPPTRRYTYGFRRTSIFAALLNSMILLIAVGAIGWEAVKRFSEPRPASPDIMMAVAGIGVIVNGASALLLARGRKKDLNLRGAFLHMTADAAVSLGVVFSGLGIRLTGWQAIDPAVSLVIAAVITAGTWGLLRSSVNLALDAVPPGIALPSIEAYLVAQPCVAAVHDLHVWAMSTTETALTVHVVLRGADLDDSFLARVSEDLHARFGIQHATIQLERGDKSHPCSLAPADVV